VEHVYKGIIGLIFILTSKFFSDISFYLDANEASLGMSGTTQMPEKLKINKTNTIPPQEKEKGGKYA